MSVYYTVQNRERTCVPPDFSEDAFSYPIGVDRHKRVVLELCSGDGCWLRPCGIPSTVQRVDLIPALLLNYMIYPMIVVCWTLTLLSPRRCTPWRLEVSWRKPPDRRLEPDLFASALPDNHLRHHNRQYPRPCFPLYVQWTDSEQHHRFSHSEGVASRSFPSSSLVHLFEGTHCILARG